MTTERAENTVVFLDDGRTVLVRAPSDADLACLANLDGVPLAYFAAVQGPGCYQAVPAVVAAFLDGSLVAAAWLHNVGGEPCVANFGVTILPAFNRSGIAPVLLHQLALEAVRRGVLTVKSCVGRGTRDHMNDCRSAGLPVLSAMGFGGVTEIVLGTSVCASPRWYRWRQACFAN